MAPIKSSAVELTDNNYERLVEDSNDVWIIQVYQDGDSGSEHFADMWENVVKEYQGILFFFILSLFRYCQVRKNQLTDLITRPQKTPHQYHRPTYCHHC